MGSTHPLCQQKRAVGLRVFLSFPCLNKAWEAETKTPTEKLVLVALADMANIHTGKCWPGVARLAKICRLTERSIFNAIKALHKGGFIHIESGGGRHKTNVYVLPWDKETVNHVQGNGYQNPELRSKNPERGSLNPELRSPQSSVIPKESKGERNGAPRFPKDFKILIDAANEERDKLKNRHSPAWNDASAYQEYKELGVKAKAWRKQQLSIHL